MKIILSTLAVSFFMVSLSGCDQLGFGQKEEVTVEYLLKNPEAHKAENKRCSKLNFMEQSADPQCEIARETTRQKNKL